MSAGLAALLVIGLLAGALVLDLVMPADAPAPADDERGSTTILPEHR